MVMPVLTATLEAAKQSATMTRMRQLHIAFKLYQFDYDGDGLYGSPTAMGLPNAVPEFYGGALFSVYPNRGMWQSPCGRHPDVPTINTDYSYFVSGASEDRWIEHSTKMQESSILLVDENCNSSGQSLFAEYFQKRLVGITLGGTARARLVRGLQFGVEPWEKQ